jgi:hypothetical protein
VSPFLIPRVWIGLLITVSCAGPGTPPVAQQPLAVLIPAATQRDQPVKPIPEPQPVTPEPAATAFAEAPRAECAGQCNGRIGKQLEAALVTHARRSRRCYERELSRNPKLTVRTTITARLSTAGVPCSVHTSQTTNKTVSDCLVDAFLAASFPATETGECAEVIIPVNFVP